MRAGGSSFSDEERFPSRAEGTAGVAGRDLRSASTRARDERTRERRGRVERPPVDGVARRASGNGLAGQVPFRLPSDSRHDRAGRPSRATSLALRDSLAKTAPAPTLVDECHSARPASTWPPRRCPHLRAFRPGPPTASSSPTPSPRPQRPPRTRRDPGRPARLGGSAPGGSALRARAPAQQHQREHRQRHRRRARRRERRASRIAPGVSGRRARRARLRRAPERLVPMTRRLTVPRGVLGSYDIISRASDPDDVPTDGEGADEDCIERTLLVTPRAASRPPPSSTYAGPPERTSRVCRAPPAPPGTRGARR